jgi:hypothetical protein
MDNEIALRKIRFLASLAKEYREWGRAQAYNKVLEILSGGPKRTSRKLSLEEANEMLPEHQMEAAIPSADWVYSRAPRNRWRVLYLSGFGQWDLSWREGKGWTLTGRDGDCLLTDSPFNEVVDRMEADVDAALTLC